MGIDYGATYGNIVTPCAGGGILWYHPELGPVYGGSLANGDELVGSMFYHLVELYPSFLWQRRLLDPPFQSSSNTLLLIGGMRGREQFGSENNGSTATPPWAWQGEAITKVPGFYWNSWSQDGTTGGSTSRSVTSALTGAFVTAPDRDAALRFSGIPDLNFPTRYNPYVSNPPEYSIGSSNMVLDGTLPPGDIAIIHGPAQLPTGTNCYWYASTSVGSPTFFAWSIDGNIIGSSSDLWYAAPEGTFELTFQVFDDYGHGASTSISVTASGDGPMCYVE